MRSNPVPTIERRPSLPKTHMVVLAGPMFHCFPLAPWKLLKQLFAFERSLHNQLYTPLQSSASLAIERSPPTWQHRSFFINRTLSVNFMWLHFFEPLLAAETTVWLYTFVLNVNHSHFILFNAYLHLHFVFSFYGRLIFN
jgi:hypothetical protein